MYSFIVKVLEIISGKETYLTLLNVFRGNRRVVKYRVLIPNDLTVLKHTLFFCPPFRLFFLTSFIEVVEFSSHFLYTDSLTLVLSFRTDI